jgi:putative transposase
VPTGLKRYYGANDLHFITFSCYRRQQFLATAARRDCFLHILEEVRKKYEFLLVGYVVMPEHVHLLIGESKLADPSAAIKVIKQRVSRQLLRNRRRGPGPSETVTAQREFWQKRFYDFNGFTKRKRIEKLKYMHRNPVKRGLVASPELWMWSSFNSYATGIDHIVTVDVIVYFPALSDGVQEQLSPTHSLRE